MLARRDGLSHLGREIGIVDRFFGMGAEVRYGVLGLLEIASNLLFQTKAGMIAADCDAHDPPDVWLWTRSDSNTLRPAISHLAHLTTHCHPPDQVSRIAASVIAPWRRITG